MPFSPWSKAGLVLFCSLLNQPGDGGDTSCPAVTACRGWGWTAAMLGAVSAALGLWEPGTTFAAMLS